MKLAQEEHMEVNARDRESSEFMQRKVLLLFDHCSDMRKGH